jgi:hypothetical protein
MALDESAPFDSALLDPEDAKLITLARGARARIGARTGASLRDTMGRTFSAAEIHLPSLALSALQLAVAQAVAAGAQGCECAVILTVEPLSEPDHAADPGFAALQDFAGPSIPVLICNADGDLLARLSTR